jgi:hypothetical protein
MHLGLLTQSRRYFRTERDRRGNRAARANNTAADLSALGSTPWKGITERRHVIFPLEKESVAGVTDHTKCMGKNTIFP